MRTRLTTQLEATRATSTAWRPDGLLTLLLLWTSLLSGILVWLPMVRGLIEGSAYQWQFADGIGGRGTAGAYWLLPVTTVCVFSLLYLGWRGARQPFHWLLLVFHGSLAAAVSYAAIQHPEQLFLEGATWGFRFSFAKAGPLIFGGIAAAALAWVIRDLPRHRRREAPRWVWTRANRVRLALVIGMIPAQVVLLRTWGPLGGAAMIGVFLTIWQWLMITHRLLAPMPAHD